MKAVVQRVKSAEVLVNKKKIAAIAHGLLVFLGVEVGDSPNSAAFLAEKIANLRIFEDEAGKMNLSVRDVDGEVLVVSQFTLLADCRKGNRPAFIRAEKPERAQSLYEEFINKIKLFVKNTASGIFQETMLINIANDGPVTIILEDRRGAGDADC
jgi:D-tyrosyl-tRNA(Tyr) deacylase